MRIPILVTLDQNYVPQLRVLLTSIYINHPGQGFDIYLLHSRIPEEVLEHLSEEIRLFDYRLISVRTDEKVFEAAKVTDRYPKEMYYRLLAAKWLPEDIDKILYLDPDILVINPLYELWDMNIEEFLFAAATHTRKTAVANNMNKIRLGTSTDYYNSGVLLINLKKAREEIIPEEIFHFVEENSMELILPDQDVLNVLYGEKILSLNDSIWNYDARNYHSYMIRSGGVENMTWMMSNTSILHFCGRDKPWKKNYRRRFGALYHHYMSLADRYLQNV